MESLLSGFEVALSLQNVFYVFIGVLVGTVVGLLPGLGPTAAISILLPFTFSLEPASAIILLAGIYYGSMFGGRIPAILMNLPGDSSSVVTTFDGFPLRQQGKAGIALTITAVGSFIGGTIAILGLTLLAPMISKWALNIGPPEMFLLAFAGLMMIALLVEQHRIAAFSAAGIGVLLAAVGTDSVTGAPRFTFGSFSLMDGISIVPLAVGLFGLSELMLEAERRFAPSKVGNVGSLRPSKAEWLQTRMAIVRASIIGFIIGILPGGGGTLSSVLAYGVEKRFSKHPEKFGKGAVDGIAATETADNASANASFIPLLTLGIPPNSVLAVIAGALMLQGVSPGPRLIVNEPDIFWGVIASMYIGSIMLLVLNLPLIGVFTKILEIPPYILLSVILAVSIAGVYSVRNNWFDLLVMALAGLMGYIFKKLSVPVAPFILAFVLAPILEGEFRTTMLISHGDLSVFVTRPVSLVIIIVVAAVATFYSIASARSSKAQRAKLANPEFSQR
ncbi:tripartite tricarboxylate transporter permease [Arthrobacter crystallopoietes]|uniref:tripartite tricarboxylate transporter permease n=1 Tax=Crystallibacter crystallopoietes TaxID=37928 RepID=UPI0011115FC9|nr:tripartite tricarboxylate transporter permease [Arthrobacter crystallopoietes]